jgi:PRTRC genetic system protein E
MNQNLLDFFTPIHSSMSEGESFRMDITRKGNSLNIAFIPMLKDDESKIPEEAKQVRAALSMPLVMREMSLETLADEFAKRLQGFGNARSGAVSAYDELLASLQDAKASAKNATKKTKVVEKTAKPEITDGEAEEGCESACGTSNQSEPAEKKAGGVLGF